MDIHPLQDTLNLYSSVTALYMNYIGDNAYRKITDFLFHYFHEVGMIRNDLSFYLNPDYGNLTDELKQAMIDVSKIIIGEEINAN